MKSATRVQILDEAVLVLFRANVLGEGMKLSSPYRYGGARGVMVIVVGNGHGDTSSNPGRD